MLMKRVTLWDSDEVQRYIDTAPWSNGRREQVSLARLLQIIDALVAAGLIEKDVRHPDDLRIKCIRKI